MGFSFVTNTKVSDDVLDGVTVNLNRSLSKIWQKTGVSKGSQGCERKSLTNGGFELLLKSLNGNDLGRTYPSSMVCNKMKSFFPPKEEVHGCAQV